MKNILKEITKDQKNYFIILAILVYIANLVIYIIKLNQLPSPLLGGDLYYQLGSVNHIKYGGYLFGGSNILGALPGYLPFYGMIVALFSNIFGLDGISSMLYMSIVFSILSFLIIFFVSYKLFNNKPIALLTALLILSIKESMILKYTPFTSFIITPLVFISLLYTIKNKNYKTAVLTGLIYGISSISHGVSFIASSILIGMCFLYFGIIENLKNKVEMKKMLKIFLLVILIGVLIAQLYWFKPLFVYHGQTAENYLDWNNKDFGNGSIQRDFFFDTIRGVFFSFSDISNSIISVLCIIGLITLFLIKNRSLLIKYIYVYLVTAIIGLFHYFLSRPLIGTDFYPVRMSDFFIPLTKIILIGLGLTLIIKKIKFLAKPAAILLITMIILPLNVIEFRNYTQENIWAKQGMNPLETRFTEMQDYVIENTNVNDVFLSSNELSFALNGLTGRKVLVTRRAQNDPFLDMEERVKAAAVILYSNNDELRKEYINKFQVKYLYWDAEWITSEYRLDEEGKVVGRFDPLILFDTPENRKFLDDNEIKYFTQRTWVDPTLQSDEYKQFDLLFIIAKRNSFETPWDGSLDKYLKEEWSYKDTNLNTAVTKIYSIDTPV